MSPVKSSLANSMPEEIERTKKWVETWRKAGPILEKIRREEIRNLDAFKTISLLCDPADYKVPPRAPKPTSGLIEQQYWFMKVARREIKNPAASGEVLLISEERELAIAVELVVSLALFFNIVADHPFIAMFAHRAGEVPVRPKLSSP